MRRMFWSELRYLRSAIQADEGYLSNAPLSPRKRRALIASIELQRIRLNELNAELRGEKKGHAAQC